MAEMEGEPPGQLLQKDEQVPSTKKPRKRLKKICAQIREQMEFYFSDANIHKDRFMKQAITEHPQGYLSLSVFANFNKLRQITTDMKLVAKALSTSKHLEVNESKDLVRRRKPYVEPKDVDDRTLYVECFPKDVDHDWLKQTFSEYGKVVYVSLPRYKSTGDVKGFAFIEFESAEAVERSCQSLLPVDPDSDKTQRFPKFNKQLQTLQKQMNTTGTVEKGEERRVRRRRNTSESSAGDVPDALAPKRHKSEPKATENKVKRSSEEEQRQTNDDDQENEKNTKPEPLSRKRSAAEHEETEKKRVRSEGNLQETNIDKTGEKSDSLNTEILSDSEKKTKETMKGGLKEGTQGEVIERPTEEEKGTTSDSGSGKAKGGETENEGARSVEKEGVKGVMVDPTKRKRLSDVGLGETDGREVKRVRISEQVEVKENVVETHKKRRKKTKKRKEQKEKTEDVYPNIKVIPKTTWLQLRNEYLQLQKSSMKNLKKSLKTVQKSETKGAAHPAIPLDSYTKSSEKKEVKTEARKLPFTPGVIVKVESLKPLVRKELKDTLSLVAVVPYVDLQDGDHHGYVRCATPEDALRVLASNPSSYDVNLLQGEDEQKYWKKIEIDRENKRAVKTRANKRGAQKLIARAERTVATTAPRKHIVFDD